MSRWFAAVLLACWLATVVASRQEELQGTISGYGSYAGPYEGGCHKCPPGAQGPAGPAGPEGVAGPAGKDGNPGPPGAQGIPGAAGPPGAQGIQGPAGKDGNPGVAGPPGQNGKDGAQGIPGEAGPPGAQGIQGPPGANGVPGPPGTQGIPGAAGPPGTQGVAGPAGKDGNPGPPGAQGIQGPVGPPGAQGIQGPPGKDGASGCPDLRCYAETTSVGKGLTGNKCEEIGYKNGVANAQNVRCAYAKCPAGTKYISGSCANNQGALQLSVPVPSSGTVTTSGELATPFTGFACGSTANDNGGVWAYVCCCGTPTL